jgi:hypothetical protein
MREDIAAIPIMEAGGWKTTYSPADKRFGRTDINDPAKIPHDAVGFEKGEQHVWQIIDWKNDIRQWQWAELIDNHYSNHRIITIEEAAKL